MLTEKNFADALRAMNFTRHGERYEKIFAEGIVMSADLKSKKLSYPAQVKGRDRNNFFDESHRENLVVFECVNRLLDKGYLPEDIQLEKSWQLGHSPKSGRADICVSSDGRTLFIIECKTFGGEFNHELDNMRQDGGQLFSYWQQEQSCQWLVLYASTFMNGKLEFNAQCVSCNENIYRDAPTVPERFKLWSERYDKIFFNDVIFNAETVAYQIGVKPLRKGDLQDFSKLNAVVNRFEEILRHNAVSNKANAFDVLIALFICKLVDETLTDNRGEVSFQFKYGSDTYETFQDRLQRLYAEGMEKFMKEPITYVPLNRVDELLFQIGNIRRDELITAFKVEFRKLKFFSNNAFSFIDVHNEKLFYLNGKVLVEVVRMLQNYFIIGSQNLQTLGDLFEQLLDKGFKQNEGQFFTPLPITRFIWDSLPLDEIIARNNGDPPKIIDYACGAGHFLTEGFKAVNDCFTRQNLTPPVIWERDKLFGVEKDDRLARVSKISLFMHGADNGKIKHGDGLENYPDENITPATFDVLVANPPYSIKNFKAYLKLANEDFTVLEKISNDGSEIETLFAERISQLVKPRGVAAVILPSSILNKDGKSFVAARESLLKNFYVRAIVRLGSKTFGATGTNTVILFLQRIFDPPERATLLKDSAEIILGDEIVDGDLEAEIFPAYLQKIGVNADDYRKFIAQADDKKLNVEREKIIYFALTYRQRTLIIAAPDDNNEQEIFLGYGWSNAKGREGIIHKKRGGLLFDNDNRAADNTLAAVIRAAYRGEQLQIPALEKYFHYATLADMIDFDAADFTKKITLSAADYAPAEYSGNFPTVKLGNVCKINIPKSEVADIDDNTLVSFVEMASVSNDGFIAEKVNRPLGEVRKGGYKYFAEGDIIIAKITPCMENGKCAIARGLTNSIGFGSTEFHVFRCQQDKILTEYLFVFLNREDIRQVAQKIMTGASGHRRVPESFYSKLIIPLPPVDVQRKIVDEFNAVDAQIAAQDSTIQQLDSDIQAKFTALFEGLEEKVSLEKMFQSIETGSRPKGGVSEFTEGILSLGGEHINNSTGYLNLDNKKFVPKDFFDATAQGRIERNNILICKDGALSGKVAIVRDELENLAALANEHVFVLKNTDETLQRYLFYYLFFNDGQRQLKSKITGMAQGGINRTNLQRILIPVPPLELQEEFAAYVTNCEALKKSARARREELIAARNELVTKYFR